MSKDSSRELIFLCRDNNFTEGSDLCEDTIHSVEKIEAAGTKFWSGINCFTSIKDFHAATFLCNLREQYFSADSAELQP